MTQVIQLKTALRVIKKGSGLGYEARPFVIHCIVMTRLLTPPLSTVVSAIYSEN